MPDEDRLIALRRLALSVIDQGMDSEAAVDYLKSWGSGDLAREAVEWVLRNKAQLDLDYPQADDDEDDDDDEPEAQDPSVWDLLEAPPQGCEAVGRLYSWSTNYDPGKGPFTLFLDLIGWSKDEIGQDIYDYSTRNLGYVELDYLGDALTEYADRPNPVRDFVSQLMAAE